jgi:hypothetical protein
MESLYYHVLIVKSNLSTIIGKKHFIYVAFSDANILFVIFKVKCNPDTIFRFTLFFSVIIIITFYLIILNAAYSSLILAEHKFRIRLLLPFYSRQKIKANYMNSFITEQSLRSKCF